ncbi:MAG: class I SAM-dependent methyltransferase [Geobacteraceae bacterium]|nr:class I SAM-dependent methyltransferase [Geobacteraceae bacterium]
MSEKLFDVYGRYYDLLYQDKDYAAEAGYIDALLKRYGIAGSDLLEFGSGTGKHGRLLAERGYKVIGIERSAEMVAKAAPADGFVCQQGDIRAVSLGRTFNAVISLFHVISYQTGNSDVQGVFSRAAEHLLPGGLFLFDVWYSPAVYAQKPEVRVKRLLDDDLEVTRIAEPVSWPNENRIDVNYTIHALQKSNGQFSTLSESHPMRHFSIPELDLLAEAAGFERLRAEEFLSGAEPGEQTWGVCFVLRRI